MRLKEECTKDSDSEDKNENPFSQIILQALTSAGFRMSMMEPYEGTTNPRVHLIRYVHHMGVARTNDEVMCKCFSIFLIGLTIMWFCKLDNGSISSCAEFVNQFKAQFHVCMERPKDAIALTDIKQRDNESI